MLPRSMSGDAIRKNRLSSPMFEGVVTAPQPVSVSHTASFVYEARNSCTGEAYKLLSSL